MIARDRALAARWPGSSCALVARWPHTGRPWAAAMLGIRIRPPARQRKNNKQRTGRRSIRARWPGSSCALVARWPHTGRPWAAAMLGIRIRPPARQRKNNKQRTDCGRLSSIRSTTRSETPSSGCTRSPDEISTNGFSTSSWPETNFPAKTAAAAACEREGGVC
ncbi:hypothetical protein F511_38048 [Dorcoceras hygrometricum]|uniref:Uncharacterized protein n=1 Tax=Dorcoceras hygrometricum TaxID=472368 RepID=A0A2Z7DI93_9LAMI|nr:hypothetical protein F511_38048 [Dorcoceras hygrometricum]